jgi:hypothetical protein
MKTIFETCEPRADVLSGELREEIFAADDLATAQQLVMARVATATTRERDAETKRREAELSAMQAAAKLMLLRATYIELARARAATLFDDVGVPLDFSEEAVRRTAAKGYPFSALSALVGLDGVLPDPTDPEFVRLEDLSEPELARNRTAVAADARDLVPKLMELRDALGAEVVIEPSDPARLDIQLYALERAIGEAATDAEEALLPHESSSLPG